MPYASDQQRKFFHANVGKKGITKAMVNEFDQASKGKHLPARVSMRRKSAGKRLHRMGGTPTPQTKGGY